LTTIPPQNSCKMFEPSKNPNPIIVEIVHLFNLKRWKKTYDTNVNHNFEDICALKMPWVQSPFSMKLDWFLLSSVVFVPELRKNIMFWW